MKINLSEIKDSLTKFKDEVLEKAKEAGTTELTELEKRLDEKLAKQIKALGKRKASLPGLEDELKKKHFHLSKVVAAQLTNQGWDAVPDSGFEKEICEQTAERYQKSNNTNTGASGGILVPEEVSKDIIDLAMANTPIMELGPTVYNGLRGDLVLPKVTGRHTMYWVGEEEAATESSMSLGESKLTKKTAAAFTKVSRDLLFQSSNVADQVIRKELVKSFKLGIDQAILQGTGTEKQPKGLKLYTDMTSTTALGTNGGKFTIDKAAEMQMNLDVANMLDGKLGYLMRPEILSFMLRERIPQFSGDTDGQPINPNSVLMSRKQLEEVLGYKVRTTTLLTPYTKGSSAYASYVYFGDWAQLLIGLWEGFEIKSSDVAGNASGSAFTQRQVWINTFQGVDVNLADETGMTNVADANTTGLTP